MPQALDFTVFSRCLYINFHQLSLKDTFSDCKDMFMDDVPSFFLLLEKHFDISLFIPFITTSAAKEIIRL